MSDKDALLHAAECARSSFNRTVNENVEAIRQRNIRENYEKYGCKGCSAAKCYLSCPRYLTHAEPEMLFYWWAKTSPPDRRETEVKPPGVPAKKGGSKSRKKRSKPLKFYVNPYLC